MDKNNIGYAVLGLGVGMAHVRAAANLQGGRLVAVCDLKEDRLAKAREVKPDVLCYTSFSEMLKNPDIDAVSICTPSGMHAFHAIMALKAGKHIVIEKPIDVDLEAAKEIEKTAEMMGLKVGCVFQNRRNAVMFPMKEAIDSGRIGKVIGGFFRVNWFRDDDYFAGTPWRGTWKWDGGGSLMNQGVHTVDLMQWVMGGDVESVTSTIRLFNHAIETEDFTTSIVKFKSGAVATLVTTTCAYPGLGTDIQVTGTKGSIHVDASKLTLWKIGDQDEEAMNKEEEEMLAKYAGGAAASADPKAAKGQGYHVQDLVDAIREDRPVYLGPKDAVTALKIVLAVYKSAKEGREVFISEFDD